MLEMLDGLIGAGEFTGAAGDCALVAGCGLIAHYFGAKRARAMFRKVVNFGAARAFVQNDAEHLRNDVAGALNFHTIADAYIEPRDFIGIVQGRVLYDDPANRHGFELGDQRERTGASDLDLDVLEHRDR